MNYESSEQAVSKNNQVIIFDTTMRDGELAPGIKMDIQQKIHLAKVLEAMGVDVIEVSYPGMSAKDFQQISTISKLIKTSTICGLASSQESEIMKVAEGIRGAAKGRIHIYTNIRLKSYDRANKQEILEIIKSSVSLAKNYCDDVEWSAFDAVRSELNFLCQAIETAINTGAKTINIPDTLGTASPEEFSQLIKSIFQRVTNIDKSIVSVHCHDDRGLAVENSLAALNCGARQIECSINGLGARKGNADLVKLVTEILARSNYLININTSLINEAVRSVDLIARIPT